MSLSVGPSTSLGTTYTAPSLISGAPKANYWENNNGNQLATPAPAVPHPIATLPFDDPAATIKGEQATTRNIIAKIYQQGSFYTERQTGQFVNVLI